VDSNPASHVEPVAEGLKHGRALVFSTPITIRLLFGSEAKTFGFLALTCGSCASVITAAGILPASGRTCLDSFPRQCFGGLEAALTDTGSIFNIYFLIFWIALALVGLVFFKTKFA
jgi:hypothetical protein